MSGALPGSDPKELSDDTIFSAFMNIAALPSTRSARVMRLSGDEGDDGVTDGWQAWLRRRSIYFFPSRYFFEAIGKVPPMHTSKDVFCELRTFFEFVRIVLGLGLSRAVGAIDVHGLWRAHVPFRRKTERITSSSTRI